MTKPVPTVVIGTTNHCNARCVFCFREQLKRPRGFMEDALFERIVLEHPAGVYNLCLFGDPLMDKKIVERVRFIRETWAHAKVTFNTNGGLLDLDLCDGLLEAGLTTMFLSCYGITPEEHDRLQPPVSFDHVVSMAHHMARRGLPVTVVSNRVQELPSWEWGSLVRFWHQHGCEVLSDMGFRWGDGETRESGTEPYGNQCLLTLGFKVFDWDGSMVTCCLDYNGANNFGNVAADTWEQAVATLKDRPCTFCNGCKWQPAFNLWRSHQ